MAEYDQIMRALRNAHAAGDKAAAQRLAQMARAAAPAGSQPQRPAPTQSEPPPGMFLNPETGQYTSRELLRNNSPSNMPAALGRGYVTGYSLNTFDEGMGGVGAVEGGADMANFRREQARARQERLETDYPITSMAGEIAGAVANPVGKTLSRVRSLGGAMLAGAGWAGADAFASGEGSAGERFDSVPAAAGTGALFSLGGGLAVRGVSKSLQKWFKAAAERPTAGNLRAAKTAAYRAVDDAGESFSGDEMTALYNTVRDAFEAADFDDIADPQTAAALRILERRQGQDLTLGRLDRIRQTLWDRYNRGSEPLILDAIGAIDELVDSRAGTSELMGAARAANKTYRKVEMLENAFTKAEDQTAATGSGGNILNKYRQAVTAIINDPKRAKWFDANEIEVMRDFVRGSNAENVLRRVGKLAPGGNGLMSALNLYAAAIDPAMLAVTGTGQAAKTAADRSVERGTERLFDTVTGFQPAAAPRPPLGGVGVGAGAITNNLTTPR